MSADMLISVWEAVETDSRLTTLDKLILVRWAWKCRPGVPHEIKYRTMARDVSASRNAVKASVRRLISFGYLFEVSVKVLPGPALLSKGGQPVTPESTCHTGQPVTRDGSVSDPEKGQSVTPLQTKDKKNGRAPVSRRSASLLAKTNPLRINLERSEARSVALDALASLSAFQRSEIERGASVIIGGDLLTGADLETARAMLRKIRA